MSELATSENIIQLPKRKQDAKWATTRYANLVRYKANGIYYVRAHVCGRKVHKSLETQSIEIAKRKLDNVLAEERTRLAKKPDEQVTFGDLVTDYVSLIEHDPNLKPRSKEYRRETIAVIRDTWKDIDSLKACSFTQAGILPWANALQARYSATRYNGILQTFRGILQLAVDRGLLATNPAKSRKRRTRDGIPNMPVRQKHLELPSPERFQEFLKRLDAHPRRKASARMVRLMAYTGARISAVLQMTPASINLQANTISIPPVKYGERPTVVPMIPELRSLVTEILASHPGHDYPLLPIKTPKRALGTVSSEMGLHITPHVCRHIFTTYMLGAGVPVATVAKWRGDRDGGAMLLKVYSHLIHEHSQALAKGISFGTPADSGGGDYEI